MRNPIVAFALVGLLAGVPAASAQTVDEIIERSIAAAGGRAALGKLKSRSTTGNVTLGTPAGEIPGTIEVLNAAPNKIRTLIKADLTALGMGQVVVDQRFDGQSGYVMDSLQGNREMSGDQLEAIRLGSAFPHPFLNYKDRGIAAQLQGQEKVGDRSAFVIVFDPPSGPAVRHYIDAETYLPLQVSSTVDVPQLGGKVEQTTELLQMRDVDGVKIPFRVRISSSVQTITIDVTKVEHNVPVDETLFVKPAK